MEEKEQTQPLPCSVGASILGQSFRQGKSNLYEFQIPAGAPTYEDTEVILTMFSAFFQ